MSDNEIRELLEKIDIHYNSDYSKNKNLVLEWKRQLKKYEAKDVFRKLEEHLKSEFGNTPPKLYFLIKDLKTPEEKYKLKNLHTVCKYCRKIINMEEYENHYHKCLTIEYIERNVKKYLNQQIVRSDYFEMSDEDLKKKYEKIAKVVYENTTNQMEKDCIKKYFETKEENNEK